MNRKFISEFAFHGYNDRNFLLDQDSFADPDLKAAEPHIYIVLSRKKVIVPSQRLEKTHPYFEIFLPDGTPWNIPVTVDDDDFLDLKVEKDFFHIVDKDGALLREGKVSLLLNFFKEIKILDNSLDDVYKYEILYIGQSFGKDGKRTAPDRLLSHSTLQKIYFDCISSYNQNEIWILAMPFKWNFLAEFQKANCTRTEDEIHFSNILKNPPPKNQCVNIIEGALIKYFQPKYNKEFKFSFPNPCHTSYNTVYQYDYNSIAIGLGLQDILFPIGTKDKGYRNEFAITFALHNEKERKSMFAI